MIGILGFNSQQELGIFLFTTMSRMALGPTQSPIQCVLGALSVGVKRPGREADHSPPSSAKVKECVELYLHPQYAFMAWCSVNKKAQGQLYLYHQCGFQHNGSTTDQILCIHQILEKKLDYNEAVCQLFIGFEKAYESGEEYFTIFSLNLVSL
jgi:hypothetical protein